MEILNYVYPEDLSQAKQGTKDLVNVMIEFEDMVGAYPFWKEKYGHAQFGLGRWYGTPNYDICHQLWI